MFSLQPRANWKRLGEGKRWFEKDIPFDAFDEYSPAAIEDERKKEEKKVKRLLENCSDSKSGVDALVDAPSASSLVFPFLENSSASRIHPSSRLLKFFRKRSRSDK